MAAVSAAWRMHAMKKHHQCIENRRGSAAGVAGTGLAEARLAAAPSAITVATNEEIRIVK